jgi:hypothetical protein
MSFLNNLGNTTLIILILIVVIYYFTKNVLYVGLFGILAYHILTKQENFTDEQNNIADKIIIKIQDIIANNQGPLDYVNFLETINNPYTEIATIDVYNEFLSKSKEGMLTREFILSKLSQ